MNKEIIEKLKSNEKPYGLLSEEEQEVMEVVGDENQEMYFGGWISVPGHIEMVRNDFAFRIKESYQPEEPKQEKFIKCEIYKDEESYNCFDLNGIEDFIDKATRIPGFAGYLYPDDVVRAFPVAYLHNKVTRQSAGLNTQLLKEGSKVSVVHATHALFEK